MKNKLCQDVIIEPKRNRTSSEGTEEQMVSLQPLLEDREKCQFSEDVAGVESMRLCRVGFFFPGKPYQRVSRESDELFELERRGAFQWPVIHRVVEDRKSTRLNSSH